MLSFFSIFWFFVWTNHKTTFRNLNIFTNKNNDSVPQLLLTSFARNLVNKYDAREIFDIIGEIPTPPETVDEIKEDTFEGFLKNHFNMLSQNNDYIDFETYYEWRKDMGIVFTKTEIEQIYREYLGSVNAKCYLMDFIIINNFVDENNCARFE